MYRNNVKLPFEWSINILKLKEKDKNVENLKKECVKYKKTMNS